MSLFWEVLRDEHECIRSHSSFALLTLSLGCRVFKKKMCAEAIVKSSGDLGHCSKNPAIF